MGYVNTFYSSHKSGRRRGVAILLSNKLNFQLLSQIKDKEGRYILLKGKIDNKEVTLFNVYMPPGHDKSFITKIFNLLIKEATGVIICGGDWNVQLQKIDSTNQHKKKNQYSGIMRKMLKESGMIDIWRELHPTEKEFTFYSHPHLEHSRIDYYFVPIIDRHRISECKIGTRDVSDHSGVYLSLHLDNKKKNSVWRLNNSILNDNLCKEYIKKELSDYLLNNDNGTVNPNVLWEAWKAVLRGKLISYCAHRKKLRQGYLLGLQSKLKDLENLHSVQKDAETLAQLKCIQQKINKYYNEENEKKMRFVKQKYYETGSKAMKLLAWRLRKQQADRSIYKIRNPRSNRMCHNQEEIQESFETYYQDLYTQPDKAGPSVIANFLNSLDLPSIGLQQNKVLTAVITSTEIDEAISLLKTDKSPGSDGFTGEWYKMFRTELLPMLLSSFNYTLKEGHMPQSWSEALITVIPKEGKDKLECSSYRPISILNIDYKLFASIIARRMEGIISDMVDPDQAGFVRERQTQDNIRRTLHVADHIIKENMSATLISLDAMAAFDSVGFEYLYQVLERFGFNEKSVKCIRSLYSSPTARIKINGHLSRSIKLERGCRQGCVLSPGLFALFLKPLAQAIREDPEIQGVLIGNTEYKISLFADDILLTLGSPENSLPKLMSVLSTFGTYSGYKLNTHKTQLLTYNYTPSSGLRSKFDFKWDALAVKYLGIWIPKDLSEIYDKNYGPVVRSIKADLDRWSLLPLDMSNRIETIKMNVLPRYLYLFQSLPVSIPSKDLNEWNKMISRFIWNSKRPRVKFKTLQLPKDKGGLSLPCLEDYFIAAQLRPLICWCNPAYYAKWKELELSQFEIPAQAILGDKVIWARYQKKVNRWNKVALGTWFKICKRLHLDKPMRMLKWVSFDSEFKPSQLDRRYEQWAASGISAYCTLFSKGTFVSFSQLSDMYNLGKSDFFRYLQVRDYFNKVINQKEVTEPNLVNLFKSAYNNNDSQHLISQIYNGLQNSKNHSTMSVKQKWEKESGLEISEEVWNSIWESQSRTTNSRSWREFAWKNTIRFFITPKLKCLQLAGQDQGQCWRQCGKLMADHFHIFWDCPSIQPYWQEVVRELITIFEVNIDCSFVTVYLGKVPADLRSQDTYLYKIILVACKKAITRKWLQATPPSKEDWTTTVNEIKTMEYLTFSLRLRAEQFMKNWTKWSSYCLMGNVTL